MEALARLAGIAAIGVVYLTPNAASPAEDSTRQTATASPHSSSWDESLHRILRSAGMENPLREDRQRPMDSRWLKIEKHGIDGSGLFPGMVHIARNAKEVKSLSGQLKPGDQLVLAAGEWKDVQLTFRGQGIAEKPILIRAERPGGLVFTGSSTALFYGEHLVVLDLEFRKVIVSKSGTVIFKLGSGWEKPANHCIAARIKIDDCNSVVSDDWPRIRAFYLSVCGQGNTIVGCDFSNLKNFGQMLCAHELPKDGLQQLHVLNNRFVGRPKVGKQNGYELIQLGWSGEKARPAGSLIQGNHFEGFEAHDEILSLKASDVFVRANRFVACKGSFNLRSANRVLVQGNVIDGQDQSDTGGVRIEGADHVIVENTFRRLRTPRNHYSWALSLMSGAVEDLGEDPVAYGRAKNILIAENRFEHNDVGIALGTFPSSECPLLPRNVIVRDNVFVGYSANNPFDYVAPDPTGSMMKAVRVTDNRFLP